MVAHPSLRTVDPKEVMSALGHKRTFRNATGMSALPPKADMSVATLGCLLCAKSGHSLSNQTARIAWPVLIPSGLISNSARGSLHYRRSTKRDRCGSPPHSDPPTVGRKYGNHPLGDCPAFRAFDDGPTKQSGYAADHRLCWKAPFCDGRHS